MDTSKMSNMLNGAFGKSIQNQKRSNAKRAKRRSAKLTAPKTVRATKATSTGKGMIPWSLTLDYRSIGVLDALEKLYGLSNRDEALHLLFKRSLKELINGKGPEGKKKFELNRQVYDMDTKPKAVARHQKFGR